MWLGSLLTELWHRPAAVALIQPLASEFPYATGAAVKEKKIVKDMKILQQSFMAHYS